MSEPQRPRPVLVPVFAQAPRIDGSLGADEALRLILLDALAQLDANVPAAVQAENGEALHQMRVALRRLRTAMKITKAFADLDARAKILIATIGQARDLDVFVAELFQPAVVELGPRRGFDILASRAERLRREAWRNAIATITAPSFRAFEDEVTAAARAAVWEKDRPITALAPSLLDHAVRRAERRGRHFKRLDPPSRHRLRIALKNLRYASEFFAPLYPGKTVKHWLKPLKELQDLLGHLNDVAQVRGVVGRLMLEEAESAGVQADLSYAAGLLQGLHQARAETIAEKTGKRWKRFRATTPFWA